MSLSMLRFLLLQVRNANDAMKSQEVGCFASALDCDVDAIVTSDLLAQRPTPAQLASCDVVLLGGSGDYSVATGGEWLESALDVMRSLHESAKPTFASCWGFQAMARAMGGHVVTDLQRAELGTISLKLTTYGSEDAIFGRLPSEFRGHAGHQDIVESLPEDAVRLAASHQVENQAFTFRDRPIYCTQFHPELQRVTFLQRLEQYPEYVERILHISAEEFVERVGETPDANQLLRRFVKVVFD